MALPGELVQPYNYQETYVNQPTPSLTIMWWTNSSGVWLLGFYVNYTAVVDQWLTYYAFGQDSQGNQMGTTFEPIHVIGQSVKLEFQVQTLQPPRPPTTQESADACKLANKETYSIISGQLADYLQMFIAALALSAVGVIIGLTTAYSLWKRRR
jgi:hypothetical protein